MFENIFYLKKHGIIKTLKILYFKVLTKHYNNKYNIETSGILFNEIDKENTPKSFKYFDTGTESFLVPMIRSILKSLALNRDDVIIDFGSGQGRFLFVASEFKFNEIIGIEFSESLYHNSLRNLKRFSIKNKNNISIHNLDFLDYVFKGNKNLNFQDSAIRNVFDINDFKTFKYYLRLFYYQFLFKKSIDK